MQYEGPYTILISGYDASQEIRMFDESLREVVHIDRLAGRGWQLVEDCELWISDPRLGDEEWESIGAALTAVCEHLEL